MAPETAKNPLGTLKNAVLRLNGGAGTALGGVLTPVAASAPRILQKSIDFFQKIYYNS
jgi:hypothetical protein